MIDLFGPNGLNFSSMPLTVGASDFSTSFHTYDDVASGLSDLGLTHFTIDLARIIDSGYRRSNFEPYRYYGYFQFQDLNTGKALTTSDVRPGDFPFSIGAGPLTLMDRMQDDLNTYGVGREFKAYRSPDGRKYFLEAGDPGLMRFFFGLSVVWWGFVVIYNLMRKRS